VPSPRPVLLAAMSFSNELASFGWAPMFRREHRSLWLRFTVDQSTDHKPATPGPKADLPAKAKA
jgi:hypothetical protein